MLSVTNRKRKRVEKRAGRVTTFFLKSAADSRSVCSQASHTHTQAHSHAQAWLRLDLSAFPVLILFSFLPPFSRRLNIIGFFPSMSERGDHGWSNLQQQYDRTFFIVCNSNKQASDSKAVQCRLTIVSTTKIESENGNGGSSSSWRYVSGRLTHLVRTDRR